MNKLSRKDMILALELIEDIGLDPLEFASKIIEAEMRFIPKTKEQMEHEKLIRQFEKIKRNFGK